MIHTLKDGWRDESSEGPYTETLQTFYDWKTRIEYRILRLYPMLNQRFVLSWTGENTLFAFDTIEECKATVENHRKTQHATTATNQTT